MGNFYADFYWTKITNKVTMIQFKNQLWFLIPIDLDVNFDSTAVIDQIKKTENVLTYFSISTTTKRQISFTTTGTSGLLVQQVELHFESVVTGKHKSPQEYLASYWWQVHWTTGGFREPKTKWIVCGFTRAVVRSFQHATWTNSRTLIILSR